MVSRAFDIPVSKPMQGERDKLLQLGNKLHQRVVSQDSFLFLGPSGVGQTELCKALAGFLFDSEDPMIRVEMSEFMEGAARGANCWGIRSGRWCCERVSAQDDLMSSPQGFL